MFKHMHKKPTSPCILSHMASACDFGLSYACTRLSSNPHAQLPSRARVLKVYLSLHLLRYLCMLVTKALTSEPLHDRLYDRYQNLVSWLINI